MAKTKFEVYCQAESAAKASLEVKSTHEVATSCLKAFNDGDNDPADWDFFNQSFFDRRRFYQNLSLVRTQPPIARPVFNVPSAVSAPAALPKKK